VTPVRNQPISRTIPVNPRPRFERFRRKPLESLLDASRRHYSAFYRSAASRSDTVASISTTDPTNGGAGTRRRRAYDFDGPIGKPGRSFHRWLYRDIADARSPNLGLEELRIPRAPGQGDIPPKLPRHGHHPCVSGFLSCAGFVMVSLAPQWQIRKWPRLAGQGASRPHNVEFPAGHPPRVGADRPGGPVRQARRFPIRLMLCGFTTIHWEFFLD
jgi:hypothetical protein